jgi:hypothetical protein
MELFRALLGFLQAIFFDLASFNNLAKWTINIINLNNNNEEYNLKWKRIINIILIESSIVHSAFVGFFYFSNLVEDKEVCEILYEMGRIQFTALSCIIIMAAYLIIYLKLS